MSSVAQQPRGGAGTADAPHQASASPTPPRVRWRPLRPLATALTVLLGVAIVLSLALVWALQDRRTAFSDAGADLGAANDRVAALSSTLSVLGVALFVLLVIWSWRGAKNLEVLGRPEPSLGPGWAIGGWCIPLANIVLGYVVLADNWRGGEVAVPRGDRAWRRVRPGRVLLVWWVLLLAAALAGVAMSAVGEGGELTTVDELRDNATYGSAAFVLAALASVAAIVAIRSITSRQHATHDDQLADERLTDFERARGASAHERLDEPAAEPIPAPVEEPATEATAAPVEEPVEGPVEQPAAGEPDRPSWAPEGWTPSPMPPPPPRIEPWVGPPPPPPPVERSEPPPPPPSSP